MKLDENEIKINIISDIMVDPYLSQFLSKVFRESGYTIRSNYVRIQEYMEEDNIQAIRESDLNILWINYENYTFEKKDSYRLTTKEKEETLEYLLEFIEVTNSNLKQLTPAQNVWFGFEDYYNQVSQQIGTIIEEAALIDTLNYKMKAVLGKETTVIDLKRLIAMVGIKVAYDSVGKYRWEAPYSEPLLQIAAEEVLKQYKIQHGKTKKCIVLDCDNVLWKGTISEDGLANIKLGGTEGKFYKEFQKYMKALYNLGVILVVCSKNDLEDVLSVFDNNSDMVLTKYEISAFEVNWDSKVDNIRKLSEKLNISLEHMVFIDDSVFEIEAVKQMLPEVETILFQRDKLYEQLGMFNLSVNIDSLDIELRKKTYQMNEVRQQMKAAYTTYADYLEALEMKVFFEIPENLFRVSELSQRVNKASNGKRYRMVELEGLLAGGDYYLYSVRLEDKFGDLGTVGALGVLKQEEGNLLDLFCISCRALGRNLEDKMIAYVKEQHEVEKVWFRTTHKNDSLKEILQKHFELVE